MKASKSSGRPETAAPKWDLRLYIIDETARGVRAFENVKRICEQHLPGSYHLEVIDLAKNPALARSEQIVVVPTLVRRNPAPRRVVVGDLSDTEKVLSKMGLS